MKKAILLFVASLISVGAFSQDARRIFGKVSDGKNPMENVNVQIMDKETSAITGTDGKYEISAVTGDEIQFSYTGMKTITIKVEDVTRVLNPIMIPDVTELDEVTVEASNRRSQKDLEADYALNTNIIRTAWGYLDASRAAGYIRMMSQDEISPIGLCLIDVLRNRFAGLIVQGSCSGGISNGSDQTLAGLVFIRSNNIGSSARPAIFDVDGQIFIDVPIWLDVNNIRRIAILGNLATAAPYGNIGAGGVIVINTISGTTQQSEIVDRARLKNNFADGKELTKEQVAENAPSYLKEFRSSESLDGSRQVFEKYITGYSSSPYFVLDAYAHFVERYGATDFADEIIEEHFRPFRNNPVLMKALAYTYESQERFEKANEAYEEVFIQRPNYVQSYMDMANSYRNIGEPRQAASMYARYQYLLEEGFLERDTVGFDPIMAREYNNLLMLDREAVVDGRKAKKLYVAEEDFKGTRLVFEWSDGEAEFDLQFVNPENQYYKWNHSLFDSPDEIAREKEYGYNVKEYLVDGSLPGTWKVNVNYLGNKSLTPTYLKATIYTNYGSKSQRREVKVFKLDLKNVNHELFRLQSSAALVLR